MPQTGSLREGDSPVSQYTKPNNKNSLSALLEKFQKTYPNYPIIPPHTQDSSSADLYDIQTNIVRALFASIEARDPAAVRHLIHDKGLITPDCANTDGETPLLASIRVRSTPTARVLLALGADPNLRGRAAEWIWDHGDLGPSADGSSVELRSTTWSKADMCVLTPLMLAAATGQLPIVKMLLAEFGADDRPVGPRGETAIRLAARGGHTDVVAYLPARRSCRGAWRRLRHSRELEKLKEAAHDTGKVVVFFVYMVPRSLLFDIPVWAGGAVWKRRRRIWERFVIPVFRELPGLLVTLVRVAWEGVKGLPRGVWEVVVWILKAVPRAWGVVWKGFVDGAKGVGRAVAFAAQRIVSVMHSFFTAVISCLKEFKVKDLGHDLLVALHALLVKLPAAIRGFLAQSGVVFRSAARAVFKDKWVRWFLRWASLPAWIVPWALWVMLKSLWSCVGRGLEELISLINPKRVPTKKSRS
jgi:hypothetical protein